MILKRDSKRIKELEKINVQHRKLNGKLRQEIDILESQLDFITYQNIVIENLQQENEELKKQYCERTDCSGRIKDSKQYDSLVQKVENQQKEFISYLENEIDICDGFLDTVKSDLQEIPYGVISAGKTYITTQIKENETTHKVYEEILQKYREIIGDDK